MEAERQEIHGGRGGYGVSFNTSAYSNMAMQLRSNRPRTRSLNLNILNNLALLQTSAITMGNALSLAGNLGTNLSSNTYAIDPNYKIGYAQTWMLAVQQNLPFSMPVDGHLHGRQGNRYGSHVRALGGASGQRGIAIPLGLHV